MKRRTDEEISAPLYVYDADIRAQYGCFAGVDAPNTVLSAAWTWRAAARCADRSVWPPASLTPRLRFTASTTRRS